MATLDHARECARAGAHGAIVGRALYEGAVALADLTGDEVVELVVATPAGQEPQVRVLDPLTGAERRTLPAVTPDQLGGLFVA